MRLIVTNNPLVQEFVEQHGLPYDHELFWQEGYTENVLKKARDLCHTCYELITHPLTGSIKPNLTPYKTVVLKKTAAKVVNLEAVIMAEECLQKTVDLLNSRPRSQMIERFLDDFAVIDLDFYKSYLLSITK